MALNKNYMGATVLIQSDNLDDDGNAVASTTATWSFVAPNGTFRYDLDITPAAPSLADGGAGGMNGNYAYGVTYEYAWVNALDVIQGTTSWVESSLGTIANITVASRQVSVTVAAAPTFAGDPKKKVNNIKLWRKKDTETVWSLINGSVSVAGAVIADNNIAGTTTIQPPFVSGASEAQFKASFPVAGLYRGQITFTTPIGITTVNPMYWEIIDPLYIDSSLTERDKTVDLAWLYLEDCFDSTDGGPYLREVTRRVFSRDKMDALFDSALFPINNSQPAQNFDETSFPYSTARVLLSKSLLIESIKHLRRSYVEQPLVSGGNIAWLDRRDYLQRWGEILQQETEDFSAMLGLFKLEAFNFGASKVLIDIRSARRMAYTSNLRTRYPKFLY